jgi:hypothetical protein
MYRPNPQHCRLIKFVLFVLFEGRDVRQLWIMLGRAAILHHDFPVQQQQNPSFSPVTLPVPREHLEKEGVSEKFIEYLSAWKGFVADN